MIHAMFIPLAEPLPKFLMLAETGDLTPPQAAWLTTGTIVVAFLIGSAGGVLFLINQWREAFGAKPPLDDRLAKLQQRIDDAASEAEVAKLHAEIIPRSQLLGDLGRMDSELDEIRVEIKTGGERVHSALGSLRDLIETRFRDLDHKRSVSIGTLHTALGAVRDRVSATEADNETTKQSVHALAARVDRLRNSHD